MDEWSDWRWKDIEGGTVTVYVDDTLSIGNVFCCVAIQSETEVSVPNLSYKDLLPGTPIPAVVLIHRLDVQIRVVLIPMMTLVLASN